MRKFSNLPKLEPLPYFRRAGGRLLSALFARMSVLSWFSRGLVLFLLLSSRVLLSQAQQASPSDTTRLRVGQVPANARRGH